jgi:hypothetical protein
MALRYLIQRFSPELDGRWLIVLLVVGAAVGAASFVRWGGPAPPLDLVAVGPGGSFQDTVDIPPEWADTATHTPGGAVRVPLILAVRNRGLQPVRPGRLTLSLPLRYRLHGRTREDLESRVEPGSPLIRYTLATGLGPVQPGRLPALLPAHDTLWLEVVLPTYHCVALADSLPEFVPATPPPLATLADVRIFYSFDGGDLEERRTGTLSVRLDTTMIDVATVDAPPSFPMRVDPALASPDLGALTLVGNRSSRCGEVEDPMEILSTVWETPGGGRFITLDYGGSVRKHLYDLDADGIVERESWDPDGDGRFDATRQARLPLPEFLLPARPSAAYDLARFDSIPADSLARLDPFRRAMLWPGPVPGAAADTAPSRAAPPPSGGGPAGVPVQLPAAGAAPERAPTPTPTTTTPEPAPTPPADSAATLDTVPEPPPDSGAARDTLAPPAAPPRPPPPDTGGG